MVSSKIELEQSDDSEDDEELEYDFKAKPRHKVHKMVINHCRRRGTETNENKVREKVFIIRL